MEFGCIEPDSVDTDVRSDTRLARCRDIAHDTNLTNLEPVIACQHPFATVGRGCLHDSILALVVDQKGTSVIEIEPLRNELDRFVQKLLNVQNGCGVSSDRRCSLKLPRPPLSLLNQAGILQRQSQLIGHRGGHLYLFLCPLPLFVQLLKIQNPDHLILQLDGDNQCSLRLQSL